MLKQAVSVHFSDVHLKLLFWALIEIDILQKYYGD